MILEHKHVNYPTNYKIVNDCRVLKAFKNRNYIKDYDKNHKYVDSYDYFNSDKNIDEFNYKNDNYVIKYFDGCFMPYVCKVIYK
tara:strand:+ start:655 stop:906 length:252 start_codon:yes stop_codon:yes gene_type:complete